MGTQTTIKSGVAICLIRVFACVLVVLVVEMTNRRIVQQPSRGYPKREEGVVRSTIAAVSSIDGERGVRGAF